MRILFLGRRYLYFRNFESVIRELAARGHAIHLAVERDDIEGRPPFVDGLLKEFPLITAGYAPSRADDDWGWVATRLRLGLDYLRYQHPLFDSATKLRDRSRERTPGVFVKLGDLVRTRGRWLRKPLSWLLKRLERALPEDGDIRAFVAAQQADVMLITPLIDLGSSQIEYLRAARALRIPTALCVWSWDHLSSKALVRECPDRVLVWNETQKREAEELHGVPSERIVVTGAQCFDQWFDRQPSRDRESFCREIGLPADEPFILWVCSALFLGSPPEAPFVIDWISRLRRSGIPGLERVPILVRPHPSRMREWEGIDLTPFERVAFRGGSPVDAASRADYFDALYHSAAVAGINTSAFIEAGIVGRPVHTILIPELHENQLGTLHFKYLLEAGGGLLQVARSYGEHLSQLDASVKTTSHTVRPFVREFVRPHGLDVAATPRFVEAVERMEGQVVAGPAFDWSAPFARPVLNAVRRRREDARSERWLYSEREMEVIERDRRARAVKAEREAALRAQGDAEKAAKDAAREEERTRYRLARDAEKKALRQTR